MTDTNISRITITQCKSCPWRVGCVPDKDIPNYRVELHEGLRDTIKEGLESIPIGCQRVMACHYSRPDDEFACAGWLHNQLGVGNNIGVRLGVMSGRLPVPEVDGEQHERFEDTLPSQARSRRTKRSRARSRSR